MRLPTRLLGAALVALASAAFATGLRFELEAHAAQETRTLRTLVVSSAEKAEAIRARLTRGESFVVIARTESLGAGAEEGGWLGRVALGDLRPEVRDALAGLGTGQVSAVVRVPTGFALFRVEEDDPEDAIADSVTPALAASGAVKYVYDVSGFTDARLSLETVGRTPDAPLDFTAACQAQIGAVAAARTAVERTLADPGAAAAESPLDRMQLRVTLGQLAAYEGRLDDAIARFEEAQAVADAEVPAASSQMDEALGIAWLHKAAADNKVFTAPGDLCLLPLPSGSRYRDTTAARQAFERFTRYLGARPDDLEVRWLLNLTAMALGDYPDGVPAGQRIPPAAFASAESIGRFRDVASLAGLDQVAAAGAAMVDDFRNTGGFDVITTSADKCGPMRLLASDGEGRWSDRTVAAGLTSQLGGLNAVHGDYDNDGCPDILVLRGGWEELPQRPSLLHNNCDGTFTDVTVGAGLAAAPTATQTAVWADVDNDGWLDLFVGNENAPAQLFRNRHDGTFEDIAVRAGVDATAYTKGVAAADYDNDGHVDLYVSNYGGRNFLYHNDGDGTFTEMSRAARVLGTPQGFATWFFDYDNDGWQDLFVTSYVASLDDLARDHLGLPHNGTTMKLYRNLGDGSFRDVSRAVGFDRVLMPMGANFGDVDNDGYLDIYLGTGNPSYGALAGGVLLRNRGGRDFVDITASSGTGELHRGHGVAFADLDLDGDQDLVVEVGGMTPADRHAMRVFENPGQGNDWIVLKLLGKDSNRTAVGARITVTVTDAGGQRRQISRTVGTGGSFGGSPLAQHVGLGRDAQRVDVEIWWPVSNTRQRFDAVPKNRWLQVEERATSYTPLTRTPVRLGGGRRSQ